ncbi:MAG: ComEC/Rec2 family competence protein, partial [Lachnospiraceae bacterium]
MKRPLFTACLAVVLFTAACLWLHPPAYASYGEVAGEEVYLTGRVYAKEFKKGYQGPVLLIYIEPEGLSVHQENISCYDNFICALKSGSREPAIGSTVTVRGILTEYEAARNPGQFDARTYYAILGVSAQIKKGELIEEGKDYDRLQESLWRLRKSLGDALDEIFSEEDAAVLKTMLLGDKTSLNEETKSLYREAGILHILAISGLHITIWGMGLYKLLRKIYIPVVPASVFCAILMLLYGIMVGMPVSAM